jgi:hypothetical protein
MNITIPERTGTTDHGNGFKAFKKENNVSRIDETDGKGDVDLAQKGEWRRFWLFEWLRSEIDRRGMGGNSINFRSFATQFIVCDLTVTMMGRQPHRRIARQICQSGRDAPVLQPQRITRSWLPGTPLRHKNPRRLGELGYLTESRSNFPGQSIHPSASPLLPAIGSLDPVQRADPK